MFPVLFVWISVILCSLSQLSSLENIFIEHIVRKLCIYTTDSYMIAGRLTENKQIGTSIEIFKKLDIYTLFLFQRRQAAGLVGGHPRAERVHAALRPRQTQPRLRPEPQQHRHPEHHPRRGLGANPPALWRPGLQPAAPSWPQGWPEVGLAAGIHQARPQRQEPAAHEHALFGLPGPHLEAGWRSEPRAATPAPNSSTTTDSGSFASSTATAPCPALWTSTTTTTKRRLVPHVPTPATGLRRWGGTPVAAVPAAQPRPTPAPARPLPP